MAVPPKGAQAIIEAVLKTFAGVEYKWIPANISTRTDVKTVKQVELFDYQQIRASL